MILAFHGEPSLKQAVMDRLYEHQRLDQIVQGVYWEQGRGCHLGCITHADSNWHYEAERLFGIEQRIGYWLEVVFENLPSDECARWVIDSTEAIPCGADTSKCHHHFLAWLMLESGLLTVTPVNREAIETVGNLHRRAIIGEVAESAWQSAARGAAYSVALAEPARPASEASLAAAFWASEASLTAAFWASASAAEALASAAWPSQMARAARSAAWRKIAANSIEIFAASPVVGGSVEPEIERELCCRNLWCREGVLVA